MMTEQNYHLTREMYRQMALNAQEILDMERADYLTGVIRGLDLAFEHDYRKEMDK
jgi:hypothetical protein